MFNKLLLFLTFSIAIKAGDFRDFCKNVKNESKASATMVLCSFAIYKLLKDKNNDYAKIAKAIPFIFNGLTIASSIFDVYEISQNRLQNDKIKQKQLFIALFIKLLPNLIQSYAQYNKQI